MAGFSNIQTDFSAGYLGPFLHGRWDLDKYRSGCSDIENFLPMIQGPVRFREGFRHIAEGPSGNILQIPFQVGDNNRYMCILSEDQIDVYDTAGTLVITLSGIPYSSLDIPSVRYHAEVDEIIFTHPSYPPYKLVSNVIYTATALADNAGVLLADEEGVTLNAVSNNTASPDAWSFTQVSFISHPYQAEDQSGIQIKLSNNKQVVRLDSTNSADFTWTAGEISAMNTLAGARYVEYLVNNQWGLGRVLTTSANEEGVSAPANPSGITCYVDPVDKVVNIEDKSIRMYPLYGSETYSLYTTSGPTPNALGVPSGEWHIRADTTVWQTTHISGWVRCSESNWFDGVYLGGNPAYNGADGATRWFQVGELKGIQTHPTKFLEGPDEISSKHLRSGNIYQIYDTGNMASTLHGFTTYSTWNHEASSRISQYRYNQTSPRITAGISLNPEGISIAAMGAVVMGDLTEAKEFDVFQAAAVVEGTQLRTTSGVIQVYDTLTDPSGLATHTIDIRSNRDLFQVGRDEGRYILVQLGDTWVTLRIDTVNSGTYSVGTVLSNIPYDQENDQFDIRNGGVSTNFRLGAWYSDNWPWTVSFYERRQVYGGSNSEPNTVWFSKSNNPTDFRPVESDGLVLDTTGIAYPLGSSSSKIRWLSSGPTLVIGTEAGEWQIRPNEFQSALSAENLRIVEETNIGSQIQGLRIGSAIFFTNTSGRVISEFIYNLQEQRFVTRTVTKLANDLFMDDGIAGFCFQQSPNSVIWVWTQSGALYSLTHRKEDDYYAWAKHSIAQGSVVSLEVIPKGSSSSGEDQLWAVIDRDSGRTLEVLSEAFTDEGLDNFKANLCHLDSHVRYPSSGYAAQATIPVPAHLQSYDTVDVIVDGVYLGALTHTAGFVNLPEYLTCEKYALVGLRYEGRISPMPIAVETPQGVMYGERYKVSDIRLYLYKSLGYTFSIGNERDEVRAPNGDSMPMGQSPNLYTGFTSEHIPSVAQFDEANIPVIRQTQPYPLTVVALKYRVQT